MRERSCSAVPRLPTFNPISCSVYDLEVHGPSRPSTNAWTRPVGQRSKRAYGHRSLQHVDGAYGKPCGGLLKHCERLSLIHHSTIPTPSRPTLTQSLAPDREKSMKSRRCLPILFPSRHPGCRSGNCSIHLHLPYISHVGSRSSHRNASRNSRELAVVPNTLAKCGAWLLVRI